MVQSNVSQSLFFFFQAEDGIRDDLVTGVQTCALPICIADIRRSLRLPDVGDAAGVIVAPILVGDDVPAYLMTFGSGQQGDGGDMSLLVTEHAATICGVLLGREPVVAAAARQVMGGLVAGLLPA